MKCSRTALATALFEALISSRQWQQRGQFSAGDGVDRSMSLRCGALTVQCLSDDGDGDGDGNEGSGVVRIHASETALLPVAFRCDIGC